MLHYNFPPFSVGEVGRMGGVGRREIGHGALAWRAIEAVLPGEDESPYTLRVVSDILESNGSSSMATVCGASLALMQAGISDQGLGCRRGDGPGEGRRQLRRPLRHRRRGRSLRRHGLQGGRNAQGHHRAADGHQDHGHHGADHARGAGAGQAGPLAPAGHHGRRRSARRAQRSRSSRRAFTPSRFLPTRFAT